MTGLFFAAAVGAQSVEVIQLDHRLADELLRVVQPLAGESGSVQAHQDKLIVRASPTEIADIRNVVAQLDTPPRQLLISVRQSTAIDRERESASVSGGVFGSSGGVVVGSSGRENAEVVVRDRNGNLIRGGGSSRSGSRSGASTQQLQVLEGRAAVIQVGRQAAVVQRQVLPSSLGGPVVIEQPVYVDATTGFEVVPRIIGNQFELDISPRQALRSGRNLEVQRIDTTVSGPLGQWVDIGGAVTQHSNSGSGYTQYSRDSSRRDNSVLVKVELMP